MKSIHCLLCLTIVLTFFIEGIKSQALPEAALARWCVTTEAAEQKCNEFVDAIQMVIGKGQLAQKVRSVYNGPKGYDFSQMPQLSCIRANDEFECMNLFDKNEVDLITLEAGQGYFAGRFHSMRPILAEKYDTVPGAPLDYYAVAIKKTGSVVAINNLQNKNACMPGIGTGAGWVYPISFMLKANMMEVTECNAIVKTVTNFYQQMCLPGALNSFYNQFGNNPASVCELCRGSGEEKCTSSDPHAGFDGALRCLNNGGEVAFVRHDTNYQLVCSDLTSRGVDEFESCNFGKVPNDIVMTTGLKSDAVVKKLKEFLIQTSDWFGFDGPYKANFSMFTSTSVDYLEHDEFRSNLLNLNICPIDVVRLCVISDAEREKCERMVEVFRGKDIKPDMDCIQTSSTLDCMKLLSTGDADLCMLDAGDVYRAGKQYNLVPIAAEDYGDMTGTYKVVAAARKRDLYMTLFNLKGELFSRSCIPGALDEEYNPSGKPVNLCEACQGGGYRKCKRNSDELYYGATGAFRCLTELGGDIAFVHHLTVGDNTDGRNQAIWARNRRSDDYELLCKDGTRTSIVNWANCYLGEVPGAALMTSGFVTQQRRDIYWNIFSYGQQFFSSDIDGDFHMFDSGLFYTDLIFTDEAVRLIPVSPERQNYKDYLGWDFINQIHNLDEYQCVPVPGSSSIFHPSYTLILE
ncbi:TRFM-like protein [Mya arenaria]|uniref:TRFM-like protein n=1 Tax=Mya arenaria TaxID=6604 RepID=A0ABY7FPM7_MYAAR|nr:TRFM-like protein [Mya arenaria]WAR22671.1 TRFM-like protein [Mya arenaria]